MYFMNEYDIDEARERWAGHPVLGPATQTLSNLREAVNRNSDGWAYWVAPVRAAKQLMMLIQGDGTTRYRIPPREDANPAALGKALSPLKAFRTRSGLDFEIVESQPANADLQSLAEEAERGYDPASIKQIFPSTEPSGSWRVLDRDTGATVDRSSEEGCLEWVRAHDADDVARGRYRVIPPADQVLDVPGWGTITGAVAADGALVIWCDLPDPVAGRLRIRINVNELPVCGYARVDL